MENIRISDLNLSKSARNILFKQNIKGSVAKSER
ncbi:hypothetical protein ACUW60_002273 [Staphylococcus capitis]